jgi:hypothetical protein
MRFALPLLLAGTIPAQITATVNDPNSHGTLGDNLLSLDEGIQLVNGTLLVTSLSNAERAQLSGIAGAVETIAIHAAITPRITLQRLLTNVIGQHHAHVHANIEGTSNAAGEPPVLDGGTLAIVLPLRTNHAHIDNLVIEGGRVGIEYDSTLHYHPSEIASIGEVHLEGQSAVALRVLNPGSPSGMQAPLILHEVHIHDAPIGIEVVDASNAGNVDITGEHVHIEHCDVGIHVDISGSGGDHLLGLTGAEIDAHDACVEVRRSSAASTSRWQFRFVHGSYTASGCGFDLQGNAVGTTTVAMHHLAVHGGVHTGSCALLAGPQAAHVNLTATETRFVGPVSFAAGATNASLRLHNNRIESGAVSLAIAGGNSADVQWTNFTAAPITVAAATAVSLAFDTCEFVRSGITDLSTGRTQLTNCFLGDSPLTGNVSNQRAQPNPWIGRATVAPIDPPVGTYTDLTVDLHPGTVVVWALGLLEPSPVTSSAPFRFYLDLNTIIALPGTHQLTSRVRLNIPAVNALRRSTFYLQPVQVATQGQAGVPSLYLPVGSSLQAK